MFNFSQKISILDHPETIKAAKLQIGSGGDPLVSWIEDSSDSNVLKFCRFNGSEWSFNDGQYEISKTIGFYNFLELDDYIYFSYDYLNENGSNKNLDIIPYSINQSSFLTSVRLGTGDCKFCHAFSYLGDPYFLYVFGSSVYIKDSDGISSFSPMSSTFPGFSGSPIKLSASFGTRFFVLLWSLEVLGRTYIKACTFDFSSMLWNAVQDICDFESSVYNITCCLNAYNDIFTPPSNHKPHYASVVRRQDGEVKVLLSQFDMYGVASTWYVYNKIYSPFESGFSSTPSLDISVYGNKSFLSVCCESPMLLIADDLTYGYRKSYSPGQAIINDIVQFAPIVNSSNLYYLFVSDNLYYGHTNFSYNRDRCKNTFLTSNMSSTYITPNQIPELGGVKVLDIVKDRSFSSPFIYLTKVTDTNTLYLYDCNSKSYLTDLSVQINNEVSRAVFDRRYSRILFSYDTNSIYSYSLSSKSSTAYSVFSNISLGRNLDITYDDKEVFVCDPDNNRIVVLDRSELYLLRIIRGSFINKPYRAVCGYDATIYVKCFNSLGYPIIYKINRIGDQLKSFPCFSSTYIEPWYFSKSSFFSKRSAFTFIGSSEVLIIDEENDSFYINNLQGYALYGICIDNNTGQIFVSAVNESSRNVILELDNFTANLVHEHSAENFGMIEIVNQKSAGFMAPYTISPALYSGSTSIESPYNAVDSDTSKANIPFVTNVGLDDRELSVTNANYAVKHSASRNIRADVWHFRFNGFSGGKISINPNLSFSQFEDGVITRVPVFCWDFEESNYVDSFFVCGPLTSTGRNREIKKMAIWYEEKFKNYYLQEVISVTEDNDVNSIFVYDGKVFVCAGGYISVFSYETLNRLNAEYFADDVKVYDYRDGIVWAGSKGRGKIWKIDSIDLTSYTAIEAKCAPINMKWSDFYEKYVIHCENSIKFLDITTHQVSTIYDLNEYVIRDIAVSNDKIAISALSYEPVPLEGDYSSKQAFIIAAEQRRTDRVNIFVPSHSKYVYEHDLPYDFVSDSINFDGETVTLLGSSPISSNISTRMYIKTFNYISDQIVTYDSANSEDLKDMESGTRPIEMVYMPVLGKNLIIMSNNNIVDWSTGQFKILFKSSNYKDPLYTTVLSSNGLLVSRRDVTTQPSSSSSSSSSSASGIQKERVVQIVVGDSYGKANKWNSGEVITSKKCMLYGGGSNLEPGQRYYVSIRCQNSSGSWCQYTTIPFVMPHFKNFSLNDDSSSSSSSDILRFLDQNYTVYPGQTLDLGIFNDVGIIFESSNSEFAYLIIGGTLFKIVNSSGNIIFDFGGSQETLLNNIGETFVLQVGISTYPVTLLSNTIPIFSIYCET